MTRTSFSTTARLMAALAISMTILGCDAVPTEPVPLAVPRTPPITTTGGSRILLPAVSFTTDLPSIDESLTDIDMCQAIAGLCGAPICPLGDVDDPKGTGFSLKGCANISKLVFKKITAKMSAGMGLDVQVNTGNLEVDAGCQVKTITFPGTPPIPGSPPIYGPFGILIWPGTPTIPGIPAKSVDFLVPPGCTGAPREPSIEFQPPELATLRTYIHPNVDVEVEVEAAGSGEVDLRIPIPRATLTTPNPLPLGLKGQFPASAAVGLYLTLKGRLINTPVHLVAKVQDEFLANFGFSPGGGWSGTRDQGPFAVTGSAAVASPDTVQLRYGVQAAVSVLLDPKHELVGIELPSYQAQAGLWVNRYFENILTLDPTTANLKNDANTGVEGRLYAAFKLTNPGADPPCGPATLLLCAINLGGDGVSFDTPFACCQVDLYEQYGVGMFHFIGKTTGDVQDRDPDGYTLTWSRMPNSTQVPRVDSVVTTHLDANGNAFFPNSSPSNLQSHPFGVISNNTCLEIHSDGVITLLGGGIVPELRRIFPGIPQFSMILGCAALPADYSLNVSGVANNCTLRDGNPRVIRLRPLLNLSRLQVGNNSTTWDDVSDPTDIDVNVDCLPRTGNLRVTVVTTGADLDPDGYTVSVDGTAAGNVAANGTTTVTALRAGSHQVALGGAASNCTVSSSNPQNVDIQFEQTTDAAVQVSCAPTLSALGAAKLWVGLKNSDDVGLLIDVRAEVLVNGAVVGSGDLNNISTGSSGFNNANLQSVALTLANGAATAAAGGQMSLRVSARRTCSTTAGHTSGTVRLWYNGAPIDDGASHDAGTRFGATIGGVAGSYFARLSSALATTAGGTRSSVDVSVNSSVACPTRPFTQLGTWNITLP